MVPVDMGSQLNVVVEGGESSRNSNIFAGFLFDITRGCCCRFNDNIFALFTAKTFKTIKSYGNMMQQECIPVGCVNF